MKVSTFEEKEDQKSFERDIFFSHLLNNEYELLKNNGFPISIHLSAGFQDGWICDNHGYMVLDKWDNDLQNYLDRNGGIIRVDRSTFQLNISKYLFDAILRCIENFSNHGIIHGDLKLDQFLVRYDKNDKIVTDLCLNDFGFSFDFKNYKSPKELGWHFESWGCKTLQEFAFKYNLWNLDLQLFQRYKGVHVLDDKTKEEMVHYIHLPDLTLDDILKFNNSCKKLNK
jgi:serine/threonine protein kinase